MPTVEFPTLKKSSRLNPITLKRLKTNLLNGKSIRQSMVDAGYSKTTAHSKANKSEPCVKVCIDSIMEEFKISDVTPENIIKELTRIKNLALSDGDFSTATRCEELKGKWLAMFTDKTVAHHIVGIPIKMMTELDELRKAKRIASDEHPTTT